MKDPLHIFPFVFSASSLQVFATCELKWFRQYCQNYRPTGANVNLVAGRSFAEGVAMTRRAFYDLGLPEEEAIEIGKNFISEDLNSKEIQNEIKSPTRMALALESLFRNNPMEDSDLKPVKLDSGLNAIECKLAIELPIMHPIYGIPLILKGKLDWLCTEFGRYTIVDEKTSKYRPTGSEAQKISLSSQYLEYAWLCKHCLGIEAYDVIQNTAVIQAKSSDTVSTHASLDPQNVELWYTTTVTRIQSIVNKYKQYIENSNFREFFLPDFGLGCNSFFSICTYADGCEGKSGDRVLESTRMQMVWDYEKRIEIPIEEAILNYENL